MKDFFSLNEKSEQQQNGLFSVSMEFLCITDELGEILKTNLLWETKLGYLAPELICKNLIDFVHPNDTENLALITKKILSQKESLTFTSRLRSKDDSYRFVIWQFQWLDGLIYGAAKDLTELYHAKKDAESAAFIKNQLMSILSNEIQEPLKNLSLFLEIIGKTQSPANQKICLENIRLSTDFLNNLISGMIVTDKIRLPEHQVVSFDLFTTIEDAIIPLIVSAKRHNISIDLSIHPKTPQTVVGNPQQLKQVLSYLILNSIKCLERGKISIETTPEETSKAVFKIYLM